MTRCGERQGVDSHNSGPRAFRLGELAEHVGGEVVGDPAVEIDGPGSLLSAGAGQISHLSHAAYRDKLATTGASAVILKPADLAGCPTNALVVANPYHAFARVSQLWDEPPPLNRGIHPSADVHPGAAVHPAARIGPNVVVGPDTEIGARVRIYANAVVGPRCLLDEDVRLMANATLYADVKLGARTVVHANSVVGSDGFGYTPDSSGRLEAIAQLGGVTVGRDVSIGSGTTIDRGTIDDTVIEDGVKIDNQVQIGHNCRVGAHSLICGCVGLVGSTTIGRHCILAGMVGVGGDRPIEICDHVTVSGVTHVAGSITRPGTYAGGTIHDSMRPWKRNALRFQRLDELFKRVTRLERKIR
ncbi:MAG: UDP-3-O-(3-hydroxymyristoyl)glucosamine N-acyltransferase [Gammaproteobacteria bacterium]|nr:UDP-3-O-(3-hydroxymyristoyl)glucosamine N-acyltransferase [Gammaproteobacteria bacterium]